MIAMLVEDRMLIGNKEFREKQTSFLFILSSIILPSKKRSLKTGNSWYKEIYVTLRHAVEQFGR